MSKLAIAWVAKRPTNEPLTGLFSGPLTAQLHLLFLIGPLTSRYQFLKSLSTCIFLFPKLTVGYRNVDDGSFLIRENLPINQIGRKIISTVRVAG